MVDPDDYSIETVDANAMNKEKGRGGRGQDLEVKKVVEAEDHQAEGVLSASPIRSLRAVQGNHQDLLYQVRGCFA
eukprot:5882871-Amphidinium_carterae.1